MTLKRTLAWLLLCLLTPLYGDLEVLMNSSGRMDVLLDGKQFATVNAGYFLPGWQVRNFAAEVGKEPKGNVIEVMGGLDKDATRVKLTMRYELVGDRAIHFTYDFVPTADLEAHTIYATVSFEADYVAGRGFSADGVKAGTVPMTVQQPIHLLTKTAKTFQADTLAGTVTVDLDQKQGILFQDDRQWGSSIGLRLATHSDSTSVFKGGVTHRVAFTLTLPQPFTFTKDLPFTLTAGKDWIPLDVQSLEIEQGSALDFSNVVRLDAPAGKYGYTVANGPNFEFEGKPGVPQRFYGVNFCFSAHNISPEQSEILATRLARLGYNAVRYHHYERNICRTDIPGDSTQLDPTRMAQFDAMFAAMKRHGLYATTDIYVSRSVYASEVFDNGDPNEKIAMNVFKNLCAYNPKAMDNWKKFARRLLTHVNPHTGISYAKDPSLSLISLINEGTLDIFGVLDKGVDPRLREAQLNAWNTWLLKKYGSAPARNKAWNANCENILSDFQNNVSDTAARDFSQFLADTENAMIAEMRRFLRDELGCKALITDMNCGGKNIWAQLARANMDYVDDHFYIDHPSFVKKAWQLPSRCDNRSVVKKGQPGGIGCAFARIIDKPFTITEWNYSGPGRYRGVGGILTGCMASIQNWSGLWRFAYSHGSSMFKAHNATYFDLVADPLNQAADRASILLYLRGDLASAPKTIVATIDKNHNNDPDNARYLYTVPNWTSLGLIAQLGTFVGNPNDKVPFADISVSLSAKAPKANLALTDFAKARSAETTKQLLDAFRELKWLPEDNLTNPNVKLSQTVDRQFTMDGKADTMILNTPRTAGCFAPAGKTVDTDAISVTILDTDATVWVSSLSDEPIATAKRLLLTHLTDLQNTNERYNERARRTVLSWGKMPYLVRNGRANVTLKLANPAKATVWAIDVNGKRLEKCPATVTPDGLQLTLSISGRQNAQLLYEIPVD